VAASEEILLRKRMPSLALRLGRKTRLHTDVAEIRATGN
jgi:hypothetical protein